MLRAIVLLCVVGSSLGHNDAFRDQRMLHYMRRYGYLPSNAHENLVTYEKYRAAITRMQRHAGVPETGVLDEATYRILEMPRCGMADELYMDGWNEYVMRRWHNRLVTWCLKPERLPPNYSKGELRFEIKRAFDRWSSVANISFREVHPKADANIVISFEVGDHLDEDPFDGRGHTLAHASLPPHGTIHMDLDELWLHMDEENSEGVQFETVVAHEIGHAIGLWHTVNPGNLMSGYYKSQKPGFELMKDDVRQVQFLYGPRHNISITATVDTKRPETDKTTTTAPPTKTMATNITTELTSTTAKSTTLRTPVEFSCSGSTQETSTSTSTTQVAPMSTSTTQETPTSTTQETPTSTSTTQVAPKSTSTTQATPTSTASTSTTEETSIGINSTDATAQETVANSTKEVPIGTTTTHEMSNDVTQKSSIHTTTEKPMPSPRLAPPGLRSNFYLDAAAYINGNLMLFRGTKVWSVWNENGTSFSMPTNIHLKFKLMMPMQHVDAVYERFDGGIVLIYKQFMYIIDAKNEKSFVVTLMRLGIPADITQINQVVPVTGTKNTIFISHNHVWLVNDQTLTATYLMSAELPSRRRYNLQRNDASAVTGGGVGFLILASVSLIFALLR